VTDGSSDEIGQLGQSFGDMRRKLQELLGHIVEAASEMDAAAQGFMSLAATQKQGAERQSGAVDQGQETVQLLAECAEKLAQAATGMAEAADKGQVLREEARRALAERIEHLSSEAASATEESAFVMRAVADVADQTVESCAQVVSGAGKLVSLSQGLQAVVGKFVLSAPAAVPSERRVAVAQPSIAPAE
jgi:methyl-accepting chemotaxis protein